MDEQKFISTWLERNRNDMTAGLALCGEWITVPNFKWRMGLFLFPALLADWNRKRGTRGKKPIEGYFDIARERGVRILTEHYQEEADRRGYLLADLHQDGGLIFEYSGQEYYYYNFNGKSYLHPFDFNDFFDFANSSINKYHKYQCSLSAADVFDLLEYYSATVQTGIEMWKKMEFEITKEINTARMSLKSIMFFLSERLCRKDVKYFVKLECSKVCLYLKSAEGTWYKTPVSVDNMGRIADAVQDPVMNPANTDFCFVPVDDIYGGCERQYMNYTQQELGEEVKDISRPER